MISFIILVLSCLSFILLDRKCFFEKRKIENLNDGLLKGVDINKINQNKHVFSFKNLTANELNIIDDFMSLTPYEQAVKKYRYFKKMKSRAIALSVISGALFILFIELNR